MRRVVFNGKFYGAGLNGVHRVADRLIREVDGLLAATPAAARPEASLIVPQGAAWVPDLKAIRLVREAGAGTQRWEQLALPRRARGAVLVNLCNLAPILHPRKILMLHDVQFLFSDNGYPARLAWGYRLLTPLMARTSAQVLTVSAYSRQLLDLTGISPLARTAVLHNGADHLPAEAIAHETVTDLPQQPYVAVFGSAKQYKNVQTLFDAFADPRLSHIGLAVIGPGRDEMRSAGLSPPARAMFVGKVPDDRLRALYAGALCLAFPSRTEGFGLPPVEAALCGCPSVVAPAGAIPEVCGDSALYAGVDSPAEWAAAIALYAADEPLRQSKIAAARARAGQFRWAEAGRGLHAHIMRLAT